MTRLNVTKAERVKAQHKIEDGAAWTIKPELIARLCLDAESAAKYDAEIAELGALYMILARRCHHFTCILGVMFEACENSDCTAMRAVIRRLAN